MNAKIATLVGIGVLFVGSVAFFRSGSSGTAAFWDLSNEGAWLLPLVGASALVDSVNPCAFSILLLTIAFLFSIGKLRNNILTIGGFYILGIFFAYMLIGLGIFHALHIFNTPHFMAKVGSGLLIVLGTINIIGEFVPKFPLRLKIPEAAHRAMATLMEKGSILAAFALGGLVGLCEFPCTGGPYLMVLGLLHDQTTFAAGLGYLMLYNVIFVLPLAIILLIASDKTLIEKVEGGKKQSAKNMRLWGGGVAMV